MAGEGRLRLFKDAVLHFLKNLIAQRMSPYLYKLTHLNLIAFSTNCEAAHKSLQPVSPAVVAGLTGWLARIKPDGQTHSWLPFEMARDGAGTSDDGTTVDRILFITDGAPSEMHPFQRSLDAAKAASAALGDCPIACVAYGSPVDVDGFLKELANETKGTFDRVDIEGLREAVTAVRKAKEADEKRLAQAKLEEEEKLADK
uniref:VWFA domain-containing protein n=2 Tax=Chrysotila carterae TaxID=13221 RepID=A0A7S4B6Y6_CHRCT|eukprot:6185272-Pleurochrysis_carterae.AAC.1